MLNKHITELRSHHLHPFLITDFMQAPASPCVYLIYATEHNITHLSYIGASKSVRGRIYQQKVIGLYKRNRTPYKLYIIPVSERDLSDTEEFLIKKLRPSLNKTHNKR